jgi:hemolysin activation/secretion protein
MFRKKGIQGVLWFMAGLFAIQGGGGWAQTQPQPLRSVDPGAVQERSKETGEYYRLEKRVQEEKKPEFEKDLVDDKTKKGEPGAGEEEKTILINRIVTDRSEILTDEEIRQITSRLEGRRVGIKDIFDAINAINDLYKKKNIIAAQAYLPPQKVERGIVKIGLIESRIGKISIEDNKSTRDSFFTNRIALKSGALVRIDTLEKDLVYLNGTSDVKVRTELKPGESFATTDLLVKVQEPSPYVASVFTDNAGRNTVGIYRTGVTIGHKSLLGFRDPLVLSGIWADRNGTIAGSGSYSFPITSFGTRIGFSYDYNQIKVISGAFEPLNIKGHSSDVSLNVTQPLMVRPAFNLNGFAGVHYKKSITDFDENPLFRTRVRSLTYGLDMQSIDEHGFWSSQMLFTNGFQIFAGDESFFKYNLFLTRQQLLGKDVVLSLRGSTQFSNNHLLPAFEQYQIGGVSTVRGYPEGMLLGDRGYFLSGELYFPLPFKNHEFFGVSIGDKIKGSFFIDHGGAFPHKGNSVGLNHNDFLTGTGLGLIVNLTKYFYGRINLGFPLTNRGDAKETMRWHFYLSSNFF